DQGGPVPAVAGVPDRGRAGRLGRGGGLALRRPPARGGGARRGGDQRGEPAPSATGRLITGLTARASAHRAPAAPTAQITVFGVNRSAAAPASTITRPWPRLIPPWAMPKAGL